MHAWCFISLSYISYFSCWLVWKLEWFLAQYWCRVSSRLFKGESSALGVGMRVCLAIAHQHTSMGSGDTQRWLFCRSGCGHARLLNLTVRHQTCETCETLHHGIGIHDSDLSTTNVECPSLALKHYQLAQYYGGWMYGGDCVKFNVHNISNTTCTTCQHACTTCHHAVCMHNMPSCMHNMPHACTTCHHT